MSTLSRIDLDQAPPLSETKRTRLNNALDQAPVLHLPESHAPVVWLSILDNSIETKPRIDKLNRSNRPMKRFFYVVAILATFFLLTGCGVERSSESLGGYDAQAYDRTRIESEKVKDKWR